ncbi:translation initiation factor IF-2 [Thermopirellula anaerolimosa]
MATRIYALAKELKLETKSILEICKELQMSDKTSGLASLSDEEVARIRDYVKQPKGRTARARVGTATAADSAAARPIRPEDYVPPTGVTSTKVPVLDRKPNRLPTLPARETVQEATADQPQESPPPAETTAVTPEPVAPVEETRGETEILPAAEPQTPPPTPEFVASESEVTEAESAVVAEAESAVGTGEATPVSAEAEAPATAAPSSAEVVEGETPTVGEVETAAPSELAPAAEKPEASKEEPGTAPPQEPPYGPDSSPPAARPIPVLRSRRASTASPGKEKLRPRPDRPAPRLARMAPMPAPQPIAPAKSTEPPPQKPDMKLPIEALRASKLGAKPLAEHLMRQQEEKRKVGKGKGIKERTRDEADVVAPGLPRERGRRGKLGDEMEGLKATPPAKLKKKRAAVDVKADDVDDEPVVTVRPTRLRRTRSVSTAAPRKSSVVLELPCTVRSFAEAFGLPSQRVLAKLFELGTMANINASLDQATAELLAAELGLEVVFRAETDPESEVDAIWNRPDDEAALKPRPPVITFLGHVDHGKTSLLDKILGLHVASGEKGGITQHIRAYRVEKEGKSIAFVDTPGHEAFTAMRARGANCTDFVVLVIAADDGVMPQTEEAISHAKAAEVPVVVAINKVDLPGARPERVMQQLTGLGLVPSEWGGDVEVIRTSAFTGEGIPQLLDTLLMLAELHELKADYNRPACGTCLEAELEAGRGPVAKVLVQKGTLRPGDIVVCGTAHGRVKALYDTLDSRKRWKEAGPSTPVDLIGLDGVPEAGSRFVVVEDIALARRIAEHRAEQMRRRDLTPVRAHVTLENLFDQMSQSHEKKSLNILLRADTRGSIEAILKEITKIENPEVQIKVVQALVGGITAADVHLADASDGIIIGFNVVPDEEARQLAEQLKVQIRRYDIIYQVADDLKAALEGMLRPEKREVDIGRALVQRVFYIGRIGSVAGCRVLAGNITRDAHLRVIRQSRIIGDYPIESLRREKDDVREVREGMECGIKLAGFNDIKEGDLLEAYRIEEVKRTLEDAVQSV